MPAFTLIILELHIARECLIFFSQQLGSNEGVFPNSLLEQPFKKYSKFVFFILSSLLISTLLVNPADAKIYKWKDENGKTHFTDSLNKIPFKYRPKKRKAFRITNCHKPISKNIKVILEKLGNSILEGKVILKEDYYEPLSKIRKTSRLYYRLSRSALEFELGLKEHEIELNKRILKYECSTEQYSLNQFKEQ